MEAHQASDEATFTNDGETEYELLYDIPAEADDDHTVWLKSNDDKVDVTLDEFSAEWDECDYAFYLNQETPENAEQRQKLRTSR